MSVLMQEDSIPQSVVLHEYLPSTAHKVYINLLPIPHSTTGALHPYRPHVSYKYRAGIWSADVINQ